jgi:hypothetical protein
MPNAIAQFLGTSDEVNSCDCCGKQNLKSTVALDVDGEVLYYGVTCAARALTAHGMEMDSAKVKAAAKKAQAEQVECARRFDLVLNSARYAIEASRQAEVQAFWRWSDAKAQEMKVGIRAEFWSTYNQGIPGTGRNNAFRVYVAEVYGY